MAIALECCRGPRSLLSASFLGTRARMSVSTELGPGTLSSETWGQPAVTATCGSRHMATATAGGGHRYLWASPPPKATPEAPRLCSPPPRCVVWGHQPRGPAARASRRDPGPLPRAVGWSTCSRSAAGWRARRSGGPWRSRAARLSGRFRRSSERSAGGGAGVGRAPPGRTA